MKVQITIQSRPVYVKSSYPQITAILPMARYKFDHASVIDSYTKAREQYKLDLGAFAEFYDEKLIEAHATAEGE